MANDGAAIHQPMVIGGHMKRSMLAFVLAGTLLGTAHAATTVPVITGGVGEGGREAMEARQNAYSLKLVFTGEQGIYLSSVGVTIRDRQGNEVVNTTTTGPYLLADLEPGRYTVEANAEGIVRKHDVTVGKDGLKTYQLGFPIRD